MASQPILQESFFSFISIHTKFTLGCSAYDAVGPPRFLWGSSGTPFTNTLSHAEPTFLVQQVLHMKTK